VNVRLMADTTDHAAPAGYDLYAGYIDGAYRSFAPLAQQYPGRVVSITVLGLSAAQVCDVEGGDVTPAHAPGWVRAKGATRYMVWVADYGVARCPLAGAAAWQKIDHGPRGENIDVSEVYDDAWPRPDAPTIYCPYSLAGSVVQACAAAGLTFVPASSAPPPAPPRSNRLAKLQAGNPHRRI
jgi:hypothetical protein